MNIGETMKELPVYHTGGAPNILERNNDWIVMMDNAPAEEWVLLEKLTNNVVSNNTRIRNRVWSLNKKQDDFQFTSRTMNNEIVMFGRRR